jgi:DNA-binding NarL/FixJ family response regulator
VLVVDAEPVSRCGLACLLGAEERLRVVAQADALPVARALCVQHQPQVVVLDPMLGDGIAFIRELKRWCAQARVVVFAAQPDALGVQQALQAGAWGYVSRRDPVAALLGAVLGALEGQRVLGPQVERVLLERLALGLVQVGPAAEARLSEREMQVFRLLGTGVGTRAVAAELGVSVKTVESHLQRIKEKLGVRSGAELQRRALQYLGKGC